MLEIINTYIPYAYYLVLLVLAIVLIVFVVKLNKLSRLIYLNSKDINNINDKIKAIKDKTDYLEESFKTSWLFFVRLAGVIALLRAIYKDYKATTKEKRSLAKSVVKGCMLNKKAAKTLIRF